MMHLVAEGLTTQMDYPVYMQGQMSKRIISENLPATVMLFYWVQPLWEGVDVRGSTLSCVIIDNCLLQHPMTRYCKLKCKTANAR
ncbi:hypothetical protein ACOBV9_21245 (plasmid) [Pseudoalteromonas espejiana]